MTDTPSAPANDQHKAMKPRSPNFPAIPLEEAVELVEKIHKAENLGFAPVRVVVTQHWGFTEKSSAWKIRMAAVTSFGLLESRGEGEAKSVRVSDLGKRILLDRVPGSPERRAALREAALRPTIYKELRDRWGSQLGSDPTVETYLIRDREFTVGAAKVVLDGYKKTIAYAEMDQADSIPPIPGDPPANGAPPAAAQAPRGEQPKPKPRAPAPPGMRELPITLPSLAVATIQVPLPMSAADFDFLANTLAAFRAALTAPEKLERPTAPETGESDEEVPS